MDFFQSIPERQVSDCLRQGDLLITTSTHLAAQWKQRFVESCGGVVETPAIHEWRKWLNALALRQPDIPAPLTSLQELQLWERIIAADMGGDDASARGLARHASESYGVLCEYRIDLRELAGAGEEAEVLGRWIVSMRQALARQQRALAADLPGLLLPRGAEGVAPSRILFDGFHRFTPMQQAWLQALNASGVTLISIESDAGSAEMRLSACADAEGEYRHVARQIAAAIGSDPHARIAVVTSRHVNDTETLRRILDETLLPPNSGTMQAVNMTGRPLAAMPLIRQLMHLLHLLHLAGRRGVPYADLSPLLFSPGVRGYAGERMKRAGLDAKLREENRHYVTFGSLLAMDEVRGMPQLAGVLQCLLDWDTAVRAAGEWVRAVHGLLQEAGFLQAEVADRRGSEIRQLNAFRECLASLVAVDAVYERLSWGDFLSLLAAACNEAPLSEPVRFPQVSVLPLERIAGLRFDRLFAIGFDEEALPLPAQPLPLLPFALQRKYGLPGTTAPLAFADSAFLWQQLKQAAPAVYISFARNREERELNPSSLLAGLAAEVVDVVTECPSPFESEPFDDAPAVPLSEDEHVQGGSAIIRNQSACPFRAFASHRLGLAPLGETVPGVTPADKGSLLHRALQFIWERLQSQRALLALDEAASAALVDEAVEYAWQEARIPAAESTRAFERRRMQSVLAAWLDEERQRPAFSVERCEKGYRLELPASGAIRFPVKLKADRIDRDEAGHRILIDYKTGRKQSIGKWIGERPSEPQLPLYAVAERVGEADAVCFARVRSGDMGFEGLSGEATGIKGIAVYEGKDETAEDWPALLERWRERIDALAAEFVEGRCEVAPQDAHACDYCGLEALCRIDEIGIDRDDGDEVSA